MTKNCRDLLPNLGMDITGPVDEVSDRGLNVFVLVLGGNAHHCYSANILQQGTHGLALHDDQNK